MKKKLFLAFIISVGFLISIPIFPALAEDLPAGRTIPKLTKTADDPVLSNGKVYPFWGPICQRYTYSVIYSDKENRPPEYVQIYFNGKMIDMEKENPNANDYKNGVKYIYKNVPNKIGSNFYYFEASNGVGKTRDSIIDSPDNGPVLFDSDFKNNEIVLIDPNNGAIKWRFSTGEEWVGGIALSDDGKYLVAQTSNHLYFFESENNKPLWSYESPAKSQIGGDVKGGVAISDNGDKIFAALNGKALMFDKNSNTPIWNYNLENNGGGAYGVDIDNNGNFSAVAMAGSESDENTNVLILFDKDGNKKWQYHSSGNWHEVNFSDNGEYLTGATGCPDRRGYLFSKDSAEPLIKSEPLSEESPIDEARISADGRSIVFGAESGFGAVYLFDSNSKEIVWKYETDNGRSVRALSITPDSIYIGAGTFGGDVLVFNKNSNQPITKINIASAIGAFDITDDGSLFASGSADKKIRIFEKGATSVKSEIVLSEYVGEIDLSADGRYLAAGTSGAVYFFESLIDLDNQKVSTCSEIIEPPTDNSSLSDGRSHDNKLIDNEKSRDFRNLLAWPVIAPLSASGLLIFVLIAYLMICHRKERPVRKIFIIINTFLIIISLATTYYLLDNQNSKTKIEEQTVADENETTESSEKSSTTESITGEKSSDNVIVSGEGSSDDDATENGRCGNGICEPDGGETKDNCSKDCSNGE